MKQLSRGFTLVEMIFTVGLLALILGLGVPSFLEFSRNNRTTGIANDLLADLNLARSEAVKRRVPVTVCASANPLATTPTCSATNATSFSGWVVFIDDANAAAASSDDGDATIDTGETVIRQRATIPTGMTARSDAGFVTYTDSGFPKSVGTSPSVASATRVVLCDSRGNTASTAGNSAGRAVTISATGRAGVTRSISQITTLGGC